MNYKELSPPRSGTHGLAMNGFMNGYKREFEHFLDVVHGKTESEVKSKDILAVSKIATACEESARMGKVVELIWTKDELPDNL